MKQSVSPAIAASLAALLLLPNQAGAQAFDRPSKAPATVFVISGGVSLGSYQAGQMYVFTEYLKRVAKKKKTCIGEGADSSEICLYVNKVPDHSVFVGSSAGSINSLLSVISLLTEPDPIDTPEDSVFFRAWIPLGVNNTSTSIDYIDPEGAEGGDSLFSRAQAQKMLEELGERTIIENWKERGTLSLGITTTRLFTDTGHLGEQASNAVFGFRTHPGLKPQKALKDQSLKSLQLYPEMRLSRDEAAFSYRLTHQDKAPVMASPDGWILSDSLKDAEVPFLSDDGRDRRSGYSPGVMDLIRASSGLPLAFEIEGYDPCWFEAHELYQGGQRWALRLRGEHPQAGVGESPSLLLERLRNEHADEGVCGSTDPILMMDGGLFDNNPIRAGQFLSLHSVQEGESPSSPLPMQYRLRDQELPPIGKGWNKPTFFFLDPDLNTEGESAPLPSHEFDRMGGALSALASFRSQELGAWLLQNPDADVRVVKSKEPVDDTFSSYFGSFLGFYDRSFRVWDFYVGMRDALDFLEGRGGHPVGFAYESDKDKDTVVTRQVVKMPSSAVLEALLPDLKDATNYHGVVEAIAAGRVGTSSCAKGSTGAFCQALEALNGTTPAMTKAASNTDLNRIKPEEGAANAYPTQFLAGNLRHLAWIAHERSTGKAYGDLTWVIDALSDKGGTTGVLGRDPQSIFTAYDLGEGGKFHFDGQDTKKQVPKEEAGEKEQQVPKEEAGEKEQQVPEEEAGEKEQSSPKDEGQIAYPRWGASPEFSRYARHRLNWELSALHGNRARDGVVDAKAENDGTSDLIARGARVMLTDNSAYWQLSYLSSHNQAVHGQFGLSSIAYPTVGRGILRMLYGGGGAYLTCFAQPEGKLLLMGQTGIAPLRFGNTRFIGPDARLISPEIGVAFRFHPISTAVSDPGSVPFALGIGQASALTVAPEVRLNVLNLMSMSMQFPLLHDTGWVGGDPSAWLAGRQLLFSINLPLGDRHKRPQPRLRTGLD